MTRDEFHAKMAERLCCTEGCGYPSDCRAKYPEESPFRRANAALDVVTEWLEGEADKTLWFRAEDELRRLIATLKGDAK